MAGEEFEAARIQLIVEETTRFATLKNAWKPILPDFLQALLLNTNDDASGDDDLGERKAKAVSVLESMDVLLLDSLEVARQMTLCDWALWEKIEVPEVFDYLIAMDMFRGIGVKRQVPFRQQCRERFGPRIASNRMRRVAMLFSVFFYSLFFVFIFVFLFVFFFPFCRFHFVFILAVLIS
jgi:hypothetical protein